jgi:hypothetical protein
MKNNVITPIQKVILFQYNSKTYYEKFVFWVEYYSKWFYYWFVHFLNQLRVNSQHYLNEYSQQNLWIQNMKVWLEDSGVIEKQKGKRIRPKAANDMLEFIEVQYDKWEEKIEQKMKRENRESLINVEDKEEIEKGKWGNENVEEGYYEKESFEKIYTQMVLEQDNNEEKIWKRRVMIVWVPMIGNIIMYYDVFRMSFAYYSDTQGIHYNVLNACAMRYVCMFHCMDLFMDEMVELRFLNLGENKEDDKISLEQWKSPLRWINKTVEQFHLENEDGKEGEEGGHRGIYGTSQKKKEEGKGIKLDKEEREKLFAKLKQYRTEFVPENEIKLRNRFIYKGRTRDSCHSVFAKKIPEIKTAPPKVSLETKASFYSGLLPLKLPKFWEVEEQEILESKEDVGNLEKENGIKETDETDENNEISSYLEYKRKMGKGNNANKI